MMYSGPCTTSCGCGAFACHRSYWHASEWTTRHFEAHYRGEIPKGEQKVIDKTKYFESAKFLKAADVKDGAKFTIERFEEITTRIGLRPILRLQGVDVPLGLNSTNLTQLVEKFGENEKKWTGKRITIKLVQTTNPQQGGAICTGIRIA